MKLRITIVAAACALFAMSAIATGSPKRVVANTKLTIHRDIPLFHGLVKSSVDLCQVDRKVTLYRKLSGPDNKLGVDHSNPHGAWHVPLTGPEVPGRTYYAKVRAKNVSSVGTGLSCAGDKSKTVTFIGE
jgi:hypothetical protein